ncbi:hypothetical protein [Pleomorphovibrio marinus]|uniref:hypothetical protein n=1 Tax=Pleomorphovibrio marinus TaxID=2164132 RepID=UPI000E0C3752|nr:hypothetical protein [Pleomorphovibrio marinus]
MEKLSAKESRELGKYYHTMGNLLQDFLFANWNKLDEAQRKHLDQCISTIFQQSDEMLVHSTLLVLEEAKSDLEKIRGLCQGMEKTVKGLENIQQGIHLATALAGLGLAIISKNPKEITQNIQNLASAMKS